MFTKNSLFCKLNIFSFNSSLSKNSVLDLSISTASSQVKLLGGKKTQDFIKQKYGRKNKVPERAAIVVNYEQKVEMVNYFSKRVCISLFIYHSFHRFETPNR